MTKTRVNLKIPFIDSERFLIIRAAAATTNEVSRYPPAVSLQSTITKQIGEKNTLIFIVCDLKRLCRTNEIFESLSFVRKIM